MKNNSKFIRNFSVGFISFVCTILLVSLTLIITIEETLFSPTFLIKAADQADYYPDLTDQITVQLQDFGLGGGIPSTILEDLITPAQVEKDFQSFAYQAYNGATYNVEKEPFIKQVTTPIIAYAAESDQKITPEVTKAIDTFAEKAYDAYSSFVKLPLLPTLGQKINLYSNHLTLFKVILGSALLVLLMLVIYLLHWWWHRLVRYLSFIFGGSGLALMALPLMIYFSDVVSRVSIPTKPLYNMLTTYLNNTLLAFIFVGGVFLGIAVIAAIISAILRKAVTK